MLQDLDSVAFATSMLFGIIYALNLQYPTKLRFTFEILQKLIMELDGGELSIKAQISNLNSTSEMDRFLNDC